MVYDKKSFLAGLAVGVQLKGWLHPTTAPVEEPWVTFKDGILTIYRAYDAVPNEDTLEVK